MPETKPLRRGVRVVCAVCGRTKAPVGRSTPAVMSLCDDDCRGYRTPPLPGSLWPGETTEEFRYPVADVGTEAVTDDDR